MRNTIALISLMLLSAATHADIRLYVACDRGGPDSNDRVSLVVHPLAKKQYDTPVCVRTADTFIVSGLKHVKAVEQYPQSAEIAMYKELRKKFPDNTDLDPSRRKTYIFIEVIAGDVEPMQEWTSRHKRKNIVIVFQQRVVNVATLMSPLTNGKLLFEVPEPLSAAEELVRVLSEIYALPPNR